MPRARNAGVADMWVIGVTVPLWMQNVNAAIDSSKKATGSALDAVTRSVHSRDGAGGPNGGRGDKAPRLP